MKDAPDKSVMWVPFTKGMAQDVDPTMRPADVPLALEDVIQEKAGKWGTRPGFHRLTRTIDEGNDTTDTTLDNARACFSTGGPDAELCIVGDHFLYALNERLGKLEKRGPVSPFGLRQEPVFQDDLTYQSQDMAERDGYVLYAAKAKIQTGTASTNFDTALVHMVRSLEGHVVSGAHLQDQSGTQASMFHAVHASSCDGNLLGFAAQNIATGAAIALKGWNWPTQTPGNQAWVNIGTITADLFSLGEDDRTYDVCPLSNGGFAVAYVNHSSKRIIFLEFNSNLTQVATHAVDTNAPYRHVAICEDVGRDRVVALVEAGDGEAASSMRLLAVDISGTNTDFDVAIVTLGTGETANDLGIAVDEGKAYAMVSWTRQLSGATYLNGTQVDNQTRSLTNGGAIDSLETIHNARLISQPWWSDGRAYAALATTVGIATQQTGQTIGDHFDVFGEDPLLSPWDLNWIADLRSQDEEADESRPPYLVGAWDVGTAVRRPNEKGSANKACPIPAYVDSPGGPVADVGYMRSNFEVDVDLGATEVRFMAESSASSLFGLIENESAMEIRVDYAAPVTAASVHGGAVAIGGGIVSWYDGQRCYELGHAVAPVPFDLTAQTTGGQLSDGDYQYVGVWSFTDGRNFVHRSVASPPCEVTLSGASSVGQLTVSARTNPATNRYRFEDVACQWYRGDDSGTYSQTSPPVRIIPNIASANVTENYVDTGAFPKSRTLYVQSGELDAALPEATRIVATIGPRLWGGDGARWFRVRYSKPADAGAGGAYGLAPEFNEGFTLQMPGDREVTGLGALDDKAIIFTRESVYVVAGRGPLDNGLENDFSEPTLVNGNIGCVEARSVVEVPSDAAAGFPGGLFFQSKAGLYLLTRGLSLAFIGGGVEDDLLEHPIITSASHDQARRLVMFTCTNADRSSGVVLVFDYEATAWLRWQPRKAGGARVVPVGGCMHRGRFHLLEASGQLWEQQREGEAAAYYDDGATWIRAAIETGDVFGGQPGGWHRLARFVPVVERYEASGKTVGLRVTTTADGQYADSREISASMVDDWEGQKVPIEIRPPRHKCHSMRLRLESIEGPGASSGRGLAYSGVLVHVRPRRTPARVNSTQRT